MQTANIGKTQWQTNVRTSYV